MKDWADLYQRVVDILSVLYWVIYTEIIQAAFFWDEIMILSMTEKENVQLSSQEIQRHGVGWGGGGGAKGVGKGGGKRGGLM